MPTQKRSEFGLHQGTQTQTFIGLGIRGATAGVANAVNVLIDSNGQLGTMNSSRRFKHKDHRDGKRQRINPGVKAGDLLLQKSDKTEAHPQFGLIAEEAR